MGRCHGGALIGALVASFGAGLAMLRVMLGAFIAARPADLGAQGADGLRVFAVAGHRVDGQATHSRAIHIKCDATRHHLDVNFPETCGKALIAGRGASNAGLNTGLVRCFVKLNMKLLR